MWELEDKINELIQQFIEDSDAVCVSADKVGLDRRCGMVYVSIDEDFIAVSGTSSINYYGGFEYIDSEYITGLGHMTFYSGETSRVRDCIDYYEENMKNKNNNQEELEGEQT